MRAMVKKWGNSAAVRLPASVMQAARLDLDAPIDIREEDGRVIIEPVRQVEVLLADLLAGITNDNVHAEIEFGAPTGDEAF